MGRKLRIKHNLDEAEYIDVLEKALAGATQHSEGPHAIMVDPLAQEIRDRAYEAHSKVMENMMKEIEKVVNR